MRCYSPKIVGDGHATMELDAFGQYVELSDHLELQKRLAAATAIKPKREWYFIETRIKWWHCWRWMFASMAVLKVDYSDSGFLLLQETAKQICAAHNEVGQP